VGAFLIVLLFPFRWWSRLSPNDELLSREGNPFWVNHPTFAHTEAARDRLSGMAMEHRAVSVVSTVLSIFAPCWPLTRSDGCDSKARATSA
jgi:multiple sugar transport system permease protein